MVVLCCILVVTGFLPSPISRSSLSSPPSQVYMYVHGIFFEALEYLRIHSTMLLVWIRPSGRAPHSADANKDGFML